MNAGRGLEVMELANEDLRQSCVYDPSQVSTGVAPLPIYPRADQLPIADLSDAEFVEMLDLPRIAPPLGPRGYR